MAHIGSTTSFMSSTKWIQGDIFSGLLRGDDGVGASPVGTMLLDVPDYAITMVTTTALVSVHAKTAVAISGTRSRRQRTRQADDRQGVFGVLSADAIPDIATKADDKPCDLVEAFARHEAALTRAIRSAGMMKPLTVTRAADPRAEDGSCLFDDTPLAEAGDLVADAADDAGEAVSFRTAEPSLGSKAARRKGRRRRESPP